MISHTLCWALLPSAGCVCVSGWSGCAALTGCMGLCVVARLVAAVLVGQAFVATGGGSLRVAMLFWMAGRLTLQTHSCG